METLLEVRELYFERNGRELFNGLNFYLPTHNLLQVTGPNGVGKTTLLRLCAGLITPTQGSVKREAKCAYIGHTFGFTAWLTLKENLHTVAELHHNKNDNIDELLDQFDLYGVENRYPAQLSSGQKQRVALASLLLMRAKIWLLDEPFTALDRNAVMLMHSMIVQHLSLQGAVVMTTHQEIEWQVPVQRLLLQENLCTLSV